MTVLETLIDRRHPVRQIGGNYGGEAPPDPPPFPERYCEAYDFDEPNNIWHWNPDTQTWI